MDLVTTGIHLFEIIITGVVSAVFFLITRRFNKIDERFEKIEDKQNNEIKEIYKEIRQESDINKKEHDALFKLLKNLEIQSVRIETRLNVIGGGMFNGAWEKRIKKAVKEE